MRETGEDEGPPLRLSKKPSARVCRPQAAKKSNRFSRGVYVGKTLCAERASNCAPKAHNRGAERSETLLKKDAKHLF